MNINYFCQVRAFIAEILAFSQNIKAGLVNFNGLNTIFYALSAVATKAIKTDC